MPLETEPRPGVDTRIVLALHALGTASFASGRTTAFPQPATGFSFEDLRFWPAEDAQDSTRAESFALLLNSRLRPPVAAPEPRLLWDVYREVLDPANVRLADRTPTPQEQQRYDAARALLAPDVLSTYFACKQDLGTALLELSTVRATRPDGDEGAVAVWQTKVGLAEDKVARAEAELSLTGRSGEVGAALAVVEGWSGAATTVSWNEHRQQFGLADVGSLDGVSSYCLTRFIPTDVLDGRGWTRFELPGSRLAELVAGLPPAVAALGGDAGSDDQVSSLSVELACVEVLRTWFDPGVLRSRAWRFLQEGHAEVSDGADPAGGDFPYVVTGLVLARNLALQPVSAGSDGSPGVDLGYLSRGIELQPLRLPDRSLRRVELLHEVAVRPQPLRRETVVDELPALEPVRRVRLDQMDPHTRDWLTEVDFPSAEVPPVVAPTPTEQVLVGADEAIVVAYLLEPVGRAPAPDPELAWDDGHDGAPARPRVHVVVAGDTLVRIAQHYYGDGKRFRDIAKANHLSDPNRIHVGQELRIP